MRAVNLIPSESRSGASVGAGRSEGAAYAVLAVLAAAAVLAVLYGKANREVSSRKSQAATLAAQAQRAQAEASQLAPYSTFVALREQRAQAVATLVDSRFDWAHAFHEFGRVLTSDVSIGSLDGTIGAAAVAATPTAASATSTVSSATPPGSVPVFTLAGCATSQRAVAQMLLRLRLIDGVSEVNLLSSAASGSGGSTAASGSGSCTAGGPNFTVTVDFDALPSTAAAAAAATKPADKTVSEQTGTTVAPSTRTNASGGKAG